MAWRLGAGYDRMLRFNIRHPVLMLSLAGLLFLKAVGIAYYSFDYAPKKWLSATRKKINSFQMTHLY